MKTSSKILSFSLFVVLSGASQAACECLCVEGQVKAICNSPVELKQICSPRICPMTSPAIKPIAAPRVPPVGTTKCTQKQVYNEKTFRYEWIEICS